MNNDDGDFNFTFQKHRKCERLRTRDKRTKRKARTTFKTIDEFVRPMWAQAHTMHVITSSNRSLIDWTTHYGSSTYSDESDANSMAAFPLDKLKRKPNSWMRKETLFWKLLVDMYVTRAYFAFRERWNRMFAHIRRYRTEVIFENLDFHLQISTSPYPILDI